MGIHLFFWLLTSYCCFRQELKTTEDYFWPQINLRVNIITEQNPEIQLGSALTITYTQWQVGAVWPGQPQGCFGSHRSEGQNFTIQEEAQVETPRKITTKTLPHVPCMYTLTRDPKCVEGHERWDCSPVIVNEKLFLCFSVVMGLGCGKTQHSVIWNWKRRGGAGMLLGCLGRQVASQQHSRSSEADQKWQLVTWSLWTWEPWGLEREGRRGEEITSFNCNSLKSTTLIEELNSSLPSFSLLCSSLCLYLNHSHTVIYLCLVVLSNIRSHIVNKAH